MTITDPYAVAAAFQAGTEALMEYLSPHLLTCTSSTSCTSPHACRKTILIAWGRAGADRML